MDFIKRFFCLVLVVSSFVGLANAQQAGVKGVVVDLESYKPLAGVTLRIANTAYGATTDEKGEFFINLPKDNKKEYALVASIMGYSPDSAKINLVEKEVEFVSFALVNENAVLEEVVVTRRRERASEIALLEERRKSNLMVEMIGAQELSRKGVGDAASALAKMSGVSKMEGSNQVYVRGLGDRYNSTSLNGLPIPGNNPERKNIDLDLFPTDIVEYISIDKVYNSFMGGDFAGGNVDIRSVDYSGDGMFEISIGGNTNTNVVDRWGSFVLQDGPSRSGFVNYGVPNDPLGGYNFQNSLNAVSRNNPFSGSLGIKGGKSFLIGDDRHLNLFAVINHGNDYNYREGVNRNLSAGGEQIKDLYQTRFGYTTNTTGMLNANFILNPAHKLSYNFLFINSSDQSRESYSGFLIDQAENGTGLVQRSSFLQNKLFVNQILGNHQINERVDVEWGTSLNNTISKMPDRTQNISRVDNSLNYRVLVQNQTPDNHRYFQDLSEREFAFNAVAHYKFGDLSENLGRLSIGYNTKIKNRDFEDIQFNFRIPQWGREQRIYPDRLDIFFNQDNFENGLFGIEGFTLDLPQIYTGKQNIHAFFVNGEYKLTDKLTGVLGLRYENIMQSIFYQTQLDRSGKTNTFKRNGFLPNLTLKYEIDKKQNLRLGASKTYTLPQFKERAYFIYEDVTELRIGNPNLYPSQDYNLDLKWELFPQSSELLSFTLFGKYIQDPINEVTVASSSNDVSFINIGDYGVVYGAEIEIKKDIFSFGDGNHKFLFGANAAYMKTDQELNEEKVRRETTFSLNLTDDRSSFTGASDFLLNADVSYVNKWNNDSDITATVAYNYFSDRLYALGALGRGNQIDRGVGTLDFICKYKVNRRISVDLRARNLLDPTYERIQERGNEPLSIISYKKGVNFSLGFKYNL